MSQRANLFSLAALLLSLGIFLAVTIGRTGAPARALQDGPLGFACDSYCSQTELRTPIIELSWRATAADLAQQALEVTVYKDGFERGIFARLAPIQRDQKFALIAPPNQPRQEIIGLDGLALGQISFTEEGRVRVEIRGVEPGLNYFLRLRTPDGATALSETIRCKGPTCPADIEEPTPSPTINVPR